MKNQAFGSSAQEKRILRKMHILENFGNVVSDSLDRYIKTPVESGNAAKLVVTLPVGLVNFFSRSIDAVISGVAQPLDVPDGSLGEIRRDLPLVGKHIIPPQPVKLLTDFVRVPGSLGNGLLDAAIGTENRHGTLAA